MRLAELPVLFLDAQATAADPARGALLEIGWACARAGEADHPSTGPSGEPDGPRSKSAGGPCAGSASGVHAGTAALPTGAGVKALVVAAPPGAFLPPAVARITGLSTSEWMRGIAPARAWELLVCETRRLAPPPAPAVVHFARFEEPWLRALHERHGSGPFPLDLVCTHAIACRLLAELPRRTLRALAGYFGAGVAPLRRSSDHVAATAFLWRHLVELLAEREGILDLVQLREWLSRPVRRSPRRYPLPAERRRELPDRPGVYRLLRAGGTVLYVGKAASLRQRVSSHFHARRSERALEMLTQARDVACTETVTTLEAALLEADEIKRLAPPFNVALAACGRAVWFATADLCGVQQRPDPAHSVGPLFSPAAVENFAGLREVLRAHDTSRLPEVRPRVSSPRETSRLREQHAGTRALRARAVGVEPRYAPDPESFGAGLACFLETHRPAGETRDLLRLGGKLWAGRRAAAETAAPGSSDVEESPAAAPEKRQRWDAERVAAALEETLVRAAHAVRRARWLLRLSECSLVWAEPGAELLRLLVIRGGAVVERGDLEPGSQVAVPPGHARTPSERRAAFDVAAFDRLRVLTTELRALAPPWALGRHEAGDAGARLQPGQLEIRFGPHARLSRRRLQVVLRWI